MSEREPRVPRKPDAEPPHCGVCGVEYQYRGSSGFREHRMDYYVPRCGCWKRGDPK